MWFQEQHANSKCTSVCILLSASAASIVTYPASCFDAPSLVSDRNSTNLASIQVHMVLFPNQNKAVAPSHLADSPQTWAWLWAHITLRSPLWLWLCMLTQHSANESAAPIAISTQASGPASKNLLIASRGAEKKPHLKRRSKQTWSRVHISITKHVWPERFVFSHLSSEVVNNVEW